MVGGLLSVYYGLLPYCKTMRWWLAAGMSGGATDGEAAASPMCAATRFKSSCASFRDGGGEVAALPMATVVDVGDCSVAWGLDWEREAAARLRVCEEGEDGIFI